jgi:hypothetical protein
VTGLFVALGIALALFGGINAAAIAAGAWFRQTEPQGLRTPQPS